MKNIFIVVVITLLFSSCASNTSFHSFYKENKTASEFSISSPAFLVKMFIEKDDLQEFKPLFNKVKHFKVLVFESDKKQVDRRFKKFVRKRKYDTLFKVTDDGTIVQLYVSNKKDNIKEVVLRVKEGTSYYLLGLKTNIKEQDFDKILNNVQLSEVSMNTD